MFYLSKNQKMICYFEQEFNYLKNFMIEDWKCFRKASSKSKKNIVKREAYSLIKYINLLNDCFHTFESLYTYTLKEKLNRTENLEQKFFILMKEYDIKRESETYYYLRFLNNLYFSWWNFLYCFRNMF